MNDQIKLLAEQAGINVIPRRPYIDEEPDGYLESDNDFILNNHEVVIKLLEGDALKKFAELIVQECIECADIVGKSNLASGYPNSTAHHVKQKIQEHFGVDE